MNITPLDAARVLDTCAAGIVLVGILIAGTRSIGRTIWLVAVQAILVSAAIVVVGLATGSPHLVLGGLLTMASRGVAVPFALGLILRRSPVRQERNPYLGPRVSLVAAIAIVFVSAMAIDTASLSGSLGASISAPRALPASVAEAFPALKSDAVRAIQFARSAPGVTSALSALSPAPEASALSKIAERCSAFSGLNSTTMNRDNSAWLM